MLKSLKIAVLAMALPVLAPVSAAADEINRLAGLSKPEFLQEYEVTFQKMIDIQKELFLRFDAERGASAIKGGPLSAAERDAISCTYDTMAEANQLKELARQILSYQTVKGWMAADPDFDFVTLMMDEKIREELTAGISDQATKAMTQCGYTSASQQRMSISPELWAAFAAEAQARGYAD